MGRGERVVVGCKTISELPPLVRGRIRSSPEEKWKGGTGRFIRKKTPAQGRVSGNGKKGKLGLLLKNKLDQIGPHHQGLPALFFGVFVDFLVFPPIAQITFVAVKTNQPALPK